MSVDTTVSVGVGFVIDPAFFERYRHSIANADDYADDEILEEAVGWGREDDLVWGTCGSYYEDKPLQHWIAIGRLTQSYDTYDIPGGVIGLNKPTITLVERKALLTMARVFGITDPVIGQFMSVLWH